MELERKENNMKKSKLLIGDKIIQISHGAGNGIPLEITDIDHEYGIIGMGMYATSLENVHLCHKYVNNDGTLEDITDE